MKQLVCEMCGSTDLLKQDGVFVCQSCGCKYSVDEARKMMIEGVVDVSGSTVKVDTSAELANLYQIARRAKDDNNSANAAKYYDMILVKDPTSWEASFYVVYFKAMECKIAQIQSAAISVTNCENSVLTLIRDYVPEVNQEDAVVEIVTRSIYIAKILAEGAKSHYDDIDSNIKSKYTQQYIDNVCAARDILYTCGSQIENSFGNRKEISVYASNAWKSGIAMHAEILPYFADESGNKKMMASYVKKIGKYDPAYEKQYFRSQLQSEISVLKGIIETTPTKPSWNIGSLFFISIGVFMFIVGIILILLGADGGSFAFIVGILELILGYYFRSSSMDVAKCNRIAVSAAKTELEKKEAELNDLTK